MNKRIEELAEQAGRWCYDNYDIPTQERFQEKFAELIVQECLEQVRDEVQYEYDWKLADAVTKRVLEHFGVEK